MLHSPVQSRVLHFIGNLTYSHFHFEFLQEWQALSFTEHHRVLSFVTKYFWCYRWVAKLNLNSRWPRPPWIWNVCTLSYVCYYKGPAVTDDLFLVFVLFHHRGGGLSLPVKINERKQLEKKDGQTTCLKHLSSVRLHSIKILSSDYNQRWQWIT